MEKHQQKDLEKYTKHEGFKTHSEEYKQGFIDGHACGYNSLKNRAARKTIKKIEKELAGEGYQHVIQTLIQKYHDTSI